MNKERETVAVLFTGGKDSSLVACLEASKGIMFIYLLELVV